jgi:hypothetical protein
MALIITPTTEQKIHVQGNADGSGTWFTSTLLGL